MSGDSGDIYQARRMMRMRSNPDYRYEGMTRTQIEQSVKSRSSVLLSKPHTIPEDSGKKIKFVVGEKDIEHLVSDATGRAKGTLYISDISTLNRHFGTAKYIESAKDHKGRKGLTFHYYEITIGKRKMYLNIMENRPKHQTTLHSITTKIIKS